MNATFVGTNLALRCRLCKLILAVVLVLELTGCASEGEERPLDISRLPAPDVLTLIEDLGPCTAESDRRVRLHRGDPVAILVHGFLGAPGHMRPLAQQLAFHGLQTLCFDYLGRESLTHNADDLAIAIDRLALAANTPQIIIIGHSQGGLVARKALVAERPKPVQSHQARLDLVTVSTPFAGIGLARWCAYPPARILTLGLGDLFCRLVSGKKWYEITYASDFIRQPGTLVSAVRGHLLVMTDERGSCRTFDFEGKCSHPDYVFSLDEQHYPPVEQGAGVTPVLVKAGHLEIIGETGSGATKLLDLLSQRGLLAAPGPSPAEDAALLQRHSP